MDSKLKITSPKYQQIAADLAAKIAQGQYHVGEKIYARSALASQYGVSAETARRAICVLNDLQIVEVEKGSGVTIKSCDKAVKFAQQYGDIRTVNDLKRELLQSVYRQQSEYKYFNKCLTDLIDKTDRLRSGNPFAPYQVEINSSTPYLNHSISDINFWHYTTATIVAVRRKDKILLSPGPYAVLMEHDIFYFIGDSNCPERVNQFLYPVNQKDSEN
ncbi:MAG TPA: GntR family transcriptional regulator [Ruminococcaceae bacterium]|nr:GntR family transcriptional regulator [Oscillospiraceae bacterium]HCM23391.1 GntR family transcriptional regulator [Oscillospiraceae bacterium]